MITDPSKRESGTAAEPAVTLDAQAHRHRCSGLLVPVAVDSRENSSHIICVPHTQGTLRGPDLIVLVPLREHGALSTSLTDTHDALLDVISTNKV